jgi:hypothetical protein
LVALVSRFDCGRNALGHGELPLQNGDTHDRHHNSDRGYEKGTQFSTTSGLSLELLLAFSRRLKGMPFGAALNPLAFESDDRISPLPSHP